MAMDGRYAGNAGAISGDAHGWTVCRKCRSNFRRWPWVAGNHPARVNIRAFDQRKSSSPRKRGSILILFNAPLKAKWITRRNPRLALRAIRQANVRFGILPTQSRFRGNDVGWGTFDRQVRQRDVTRLLPPRQNQRNAQFCPAPGSTRRRPPAPSRKSCKSSMLGAIRLRDRRSSECWLKF